LIVDGNINVEKYQNLGKIGGFPYYCGDESKCFLAEGRRLLENKLLKINIRKKNARYI